MLDGRNHFKLQRFLLVPLFEKKWYRIFVKIGCQNFICSMDKGFMEVPLFSAGTTFFEKVVPGG